MEPETPLKNSTLLRTMKRHARIILSQMNQMRHQLEFCDVQIQIGDKIFKVHKLVLAASSPYFAALLAGGMKESLNDVVQIQGVDPNSFQLLLDFVYTGSVKISTENVQKLMTAADMLQLSHVVELCCDFLKEQIEPANCVGFFQFSEQLACQPLLEFTESYIHSHFIEVQTGDEFSTLTKDQLLRLLRSEELCIEDEYQVFSAAMLWIQKDIVSRKRHLVEVLDPIRFSLLPPIRLQKAIEDVTDFNLRVALQTLLREYCEPSHSPNDKKTCNFLQTTRVRPRRRARKFLYAIEREKHLMSKEGPSGIVTSRVDPEVQKARNVENSLKNKRRLETEEEEEQDSYDSYDEIEEEEGDSYDSYDEIEWEEEQYCMSYHEREWETEEDSDGCSNETEDESEQNSDDTSDEIKEEAENEETEEETEYDSYSSFRENQDRIGNVAWCHCTHCIPMPTGIESICCYEVEQIFDKISEAGLCITDDPFFSTECTSMERMERNYKITKSDVKQLPERREYMRALRKMAYRCFTACIYIYLGKGKRKPIPSCVVNAIRTAFPDPKGRYIEYLCNSDYFAEDMAYE